MLLYESLHGRQNLSKMDAAQESASITGSNVEQMCSRICFNTVVTIAGFSERTVRLYRKEFFDNKLKFHDTQQGKYERHQLLNNEKVRLRASEYVWENAFNKGEPNRTAPMFREYVNSSLLPSHHLPPHFPRSISLRTAIWWLHKLGFKPMHGSQEGNLH